VIAGTGSIGPEIDDGSIIYLLSKPISRHVVILSKVVVAAVTTLVFGALPVLIAGFVVAGGSHNLAVAYGVGAAAAGVTYAALFVMLAVLTRNAVVLGLLYALIWETTIAGVVPGARTVSVRQWATAISERIVGASAADVGLDAAVSLTVGVVLLVVVTVASTYYAGRALRSIRVTSDD
jgi:ABC-2 type transport system permease protein